MIAVNKLRLLDLNAPAQPGRPAYLSAASGLVHVGKWLYVVADDEHHLAAFPDTGNAPGDLIRVFADDLPLEKKPRKKAKPDWESLVRVTHPINAPTGALLLIPSGSKAHRNRGAMLVLDSTGGIVGAPQEIDFSPLFACLPFDPPNLEAVVQCDSELYFLNRGNKKGQPNAMIHFDLGEVLGALRNCAKLECRRVQPIEMGRHGEVPFSFTDASWVGDRIVFTAAAENTDDSYEDGPTLAAGIGVLTLDGQIEHFAPIAPVHKVEGISARRDGARTRCLLVNDEDDPAIPSSLLECSL